MSRVSADNLLFDAVALVENAQILPSLRRPARLTTHSDIAVIQHLIAESLYSSDTDKMDTICEPDRRKLQLIRKVS